MWDSFFGLGFKASKCKTLLRLAMARIKLLRNKRDLQIKQLRKEIAQLLTSGQEPSAHIRVEHIFREENILAAYDILELFCELITVRLPIIESQKLCPLDLKEAISSLIFAAPRCADLPELQQIQGLFAVKYGKEFAAAATELRPDCGVNRRIIEKLSVQAPSGEVKLKLMKEIAAEHNADWDPTDFEAGLLKAPEDLLDGPTSFLEAHEMPLLSQGKESPVKPLDKDPMAPSTSEPPLPPLRQSSTTLRDLLKQDDNKQFIPFVQMPAVGKEDSPVPPTAPAVHGSEEPEKFNSSEEPRREKKVDYADVAAAVRAAAESADRAVAAARAAAEFARQQAEYGKVKSNKSQASTAGNVEDSSGTDLDSDSSDGHDRAPVRAGISRGRSGSERKPAPDSDFESDDDNDIRPVKGYDVPRGRGAGGVKLRPSVEESSEPQQSDAEPRFTGSPTKLRFDAPVYDDSHQKRQGYGDSVFYQREKTEKDDFQHIDEGKFAVSGLRDQALDGVGFGELQDDKLKWQLAESKEPSGRYDIFDINLERPVNSYSAFSSGDYDLGKTSVDGDPEDFRSAKTYGFSNDQETQLKEYSADENQRSFGGRPFQETRESSPLFDEEYVGRSQSLEHSRLGAAPSGSGYGEQYDEFPTSNLEAATSTGAWGQQTMHSSSDQPPEHLSPTIESSLPSSESLTTGHTLISSLPESYEDDLLARFKALKQY